MERNDLTDLLNKMTLQEKINQLLQLPGALYQEDSIATGPMAALGVDEENMKLAGSALGYIGAENIIKLQKEYIEHHPHKIPLIFMADIINGYKTIFPIPLAQGCTFDPEIGRKAASVAAAESSAAGLHLTFSPMVDLVRDPRWGRVMESTGEDTYLNALFASAIVRGYQGEDSSGKGNLAACVKHFAAYGAPDAGRDYNNVELSERTLRDSYLPSYKAAVDAGCEMVMTSFNTLNRIPASGNKELMRDILRGEMGFEGVVISDWQAIWELTCHGYAKDNKEAARLALEAGVDIDMATTCYCNNLQNLVEEGSIEESMIDESVMRVLELKNKLGLFENPYKDADPELEKAIILCDDHRAAAREAAVKSFVLLENNGILPLTKEEQTAFIGPYADSPLLYGSWSIFAEDAVTIREGVINKGADRRTVFAKGCDILDPDQEIAGFNDDFKSNFTEEQIIAYREEAVKVAAAAEKVVLCIGEHPAQSGEAASRGEITPNRCQMDLLRAVAQVNPNIAVVLFSGRPLDLREVKKYAGAILQVWFPGTEGGNAIADVLYGDVNPSGRLAMSFPYCVGQVPVHYDEFTTGRPQELTRGSRFGSKYIDIPNEPLYPFGYGLSYTKFTYSDIELSEDELVPGSDITASVIVKNVGECAGEEVVQLYIQDVCGSVVRPRRELKGIQKIYLQPGESRTVSFRIQTDMLRFHNREMEFTYEPGVFNIYAGGDSRTENCAVFHILPENRRGER